MDNKIALLMSGGTDSSAAALLLKREGWQVVGLTFPLPMAEGEPRPLSEAAELAEKLGIEHHYVQISEAFSRCVTEPFRKEYAAGRTPCPCADCNTHIKFGIMWDYAEKLGIKHFATGHYAKAFSENGEGHLAMAQDKKKDQSYFLYGIKKEKLPYLHFPLEAYTKEQSKMLTAEAGLTFEKESMELCFAGEGDYRSVISAERAGVITDTSGKVFKTHEGIENYTIGQRKGLGIAYTAPLYVVEINAETNTVVLGEYNEGLTDTLEISDINILENISDKTYFGKIRSTGRPKPCRISAMEEGRAVILFEEKFFVTSPGQKLVLYDEAEKVVMGGTIEVCRRNG